MSVLRLRRDDPQECTRLVVMLGTASGANRVCAERIQMPFQTDVVYPTGLEPVTSSSAI
jgi:hypothetical protein